MKHRSRPRFAAVCAAAAVLLAACGADDTSTSDDPAVADPDPGELRAPTPIRVDAAAREAGAETDAASSAPIPVDGTPTGGPLLDTDLEIVVDGVGDLPDDDTGYVFEARGPVDLAAVQDLADAFGMDGPPTQLDDGSWSVGPNDGSAPSLWVGADAQQSWNFSGPWDEFEGCAEAPAPLVTEDAIAADDVTADDEIVSCEPEPPVDVPDAAIAEGAARDLISTLDVDVDVDVDGLVADTYADEWGATVTFTSESTPGRSWTFGFGGSAAVTFASGSLASPQPVGPFPLVDLDTAVERIQEYSFGFGLPVPLPLDAAVSSPSSAGEQAPDAALPEAPVGDDTLEIPSVEVLDSITITLVDVEPDLWWAFDVDGAMWLLPAYRFIDDDGAWHVVPAVGDDYLVQEPESPIAIDPPIDRPVDPDGTNVAPAPAEGLLASMAGEMYEIWAEPVRQLVGLTLDQFEAEAAAAGFEPVRVVYQDGEFFAVTEDFAVGRVNVAVETIDGTIQVVDAFVEGADQL